MSKCGTLAKISLWFSDAYIGAVGQVFFSNLEFPNFFAPSESPTDSLQNGTNVKEIHQKSSENELIKVEKLTDLFYPSLGAAEALQPTTVVVFDGRWQTIRSRLFKKIAGGMVQHGLQACPSSLLDTRWKLSSSMLKKVIQWGGNHKKPSRNRFSKFKHLCWKCNASLTQPHGLLWPRATFSCHNNGWKLVPSHNLVQYHQLFCVAMQVSGESREGDWAIMWPCCPYLGGRWTLQEANCSVQGSTS